MVEKLKLSTKKSLYEPVIIEIDGKDYECVKLKNEVMMEFLKFEKRLEEARENKDPSETTKLTYDMLKFLFNIDEEILSELDSRELQDMLKFVSNKITASKKVGAKDEEKKEEKPGVES